VARTRETGSARRWAIRLAVFLAAYLLLAYVILPRAWEHHEHQPGLAAKGAVTHTADGIPGDPLNVGIVGDKTDLLRAMQAAGWVPADPITLKSSIEIGASVVLDRPDDQAPVSPLYYEGRMQDLAFEKQIGNSADRRNHVRFWQVLEKGMEGRPVWLGSATEDAGVTLSRDTGQVTHRIAPDIDDERNLLIGELVSAKVVTELYQVSGIGPTLSGRNGEGDPYHTDGDIHIAVLSLGAAPVDAPPKEEPDPLLVEGKNQVWSALQSVLGAASSP
jgi:hypothetical protein